MSRWSMGILMVMIFGNVYVASTLWKPTEAVHPRNLTSQELSRIFKKVPMPVQEASQTLEDRDVERYEYLVRVRSIASQPPQRNTSTGHKAYVVLMLLGLVSITVIESWRRLRSSPR